MRDKSTLEISRLRVSYGKAPILREVSLCLERAQIIGLVGESGSGKSTLLRSVLRLPSRELAIDGGRVLYGGADLVSLPEKAMRKIRAKEIAMVFQNHEQSLSPIVTVRKQLYDTVRAHGFRDTAAAEEKLLELFSRMQLPDGKRILNSYSFELSGGMNQRVCIALSMVPDPVFLLADEPTSALDVTVQAQVIRQLMRLREAYGTGILMATHNMRLVERSADFVGVLYSGTLVEFGPCGEVLQNPLHPYTQALLAAVPKLDGGFPQAISGTPPEFTDSFPGCRFAPRCPYARPKCRAELPPRHGGTEHWALCCGREGNL